MPVQRCMQFANAFTQEIAGGNLDLQKRVPSANMEYPIASKPLSILYRALGSSDAGLSTAEAEIRQRARAKEFREKPHRIRVLRLLLRQFANPLVLLLVVAVILAAILGQVPDTFIILGILLASGFMSFFQELHAGRTVEKLRSMIRVQHEVLRDGKVQHVSGEEVVPGDIILFNAGDIIPADCRIIESNALHVNESPLTGESFPVEKMKGIVAEDAALRDRNNCLWESTNVISGTARALVVYTGKDTQFSRSTASIAKIHETAFEKGMRRFGYFLLRITVVLSILILCINLYFHKSFFTSVLFSLALAVGMAPELLPAIMTFAMAAGARRMMQKKVIVKKLSSIFNLGEVQVLCTDKTGTITEGIVRVKDVVDAQGNSDAEALRMAHLNAKLQGGFQNPVDDALGGLDLPDSGYVKTDEIPYDFISKRLSIAVQKDKAITMITKGAVENILSVCDMMHNPGNVPAALDASAKKELLSRFTQYSESGLRVMGIAAKTLSAPRIHRKDENHMVFLGFILLEDPLKESAASSIARLRDLQVSIKIITGDNRYAAAYIAKQLGLSTETMLTGPMLEKMSPEALTASVGKTEVFAETEPFHKEMIVKSLQKAGYTVAYIGDGINDASSIHAADTGISTNNATDVAKEAADFVLMEKDLSVLADGIVEGRKSFINSMKYIFITTGATFGNMFSVAGASLLLPFLPMLPKQILLTNFITDFPFLTIASDRADARELRTPRKWNMQLIRRFMIVFGIHSSLFDFLTFYILFYFLHLSGSAFQTGWFLESVVTELLILFIIRTHRPFLKSRPGKYLVMTALIAFSVTLWLPFSPFAPSLGLIAPVMRTSAALGAVLILYVLSADLLKFLVFRRLDPNTAKMREIQGAGS